MTPWRKFLFLLKAEKQEVRSIYTFGLFHGLVGLSLPLGIQAIITFLQAGSLSMSWFMLVLFVLGGILIGGYLQLKQLTVSETIEQRLLVNTAFQMADRLPRISIEATKGRYLPEFMNRFFEVATIQKGVSKILIDFSAAIIQVVFGILILTLYHPTFLLMALLITVAMAAFFKYSGPKGLATSLNESKYKYALAHWFQEIGRTMRTFKLAGDSTLPLQQSDNLTTAYLDARNKHFQILLRQYRVLILFKLMLAGLLIVLGSILVINNLINIGQFVAAEIIILMLINSVEKIVLNMSTVYDVLTSIEKLATVIDLETERSFGQKLDDSKPLQLDVSDLHFQFRDSHKPLLHGLDMQVAVGERVCVKGGDGSGKTTLIRLLSGYYSAFEGQIAYNNISIKALDLPQLRALLGEHFSENELFAGSLFHNISCGRPSISHSDVMKALSDVALLDWFRSLDNGLDTLLVPEGIGLPGHIRRRLMLARSFAGQPRMLLIEDSPMMQGQDERRLFYDLLFKRSKGITTLVFSNDDTIAQQCDRTYELANGHLTLCPRN